MQQALPNIRSNYSSSRLTARSGFSRLLETQPYRNNFGTNTDLEANVLNQAQAQFNDKHKRLSVDLDTLDERAHSP